MSDIYYNLLYVGREKADLPRKCIFFRFCVENVMFLLYYAYMWGHR